MVEENNNVGHRLESNPDTNISQSMESASDMVVRAVDDTTSMASLGMSSRGANNLSMASLGLGDSSKQDFGKGKVKLTDADFCSDGGDSDDGAEN